MEKDKKREENRDVNKNRRNSGLVWAPFIEFLLSIFGAVKIWQRGGTAHRMAITIMMMIMNNNNVFGGEFGIMQSIPVDSSTKH